MEDKELAELWQLKSHCASFASRVEAKIFASQRKLLQQNTYFMIALIASMKLK